MADGSRDVAGASSGNRGYWRMTDAAGKRTTISALPLETSPSVKASRKMPQLDGLRAFAALAVLFNHLSTIRRTGSIRCRGHTVAFSYFSSSAAEQRVVCSRCRHCSTLGRSVMTSAFFTPYAECNRGERPRIPEPASLAHSGFPALCIGQMLESTCS